jgi:tetratricopeptide (TPR) repeat protein
MMEWLRRGIWNIPVRNWRLIVIGMLIAAVGVAAWALPDSVHHTIGSSTAIVAVTVLLVSVSAWLLYRIGIQPVPLSPQASGAPKLSLLRGQSAPARDYLVPRGLPASPAIFAGRENELQQLRDKLTVHERQDPFVAIVYGPGGIGKTALALHFAHLVYSSFSSGQIFVRVAEWDADPSINSADQRDGTGDDPVARVAESLAYALRDPNEEIPGVSQLPDLLKLVQKKAADQKLIIILDDVPADVDLTPIIRALASSAVVITARQLLQGVSADIAFPLSPLSDGESLEVLREAIGHERVEQESAAAQGLVDLCRGEPLALKMVCTALAIRPHWKLSLVRDWAKRAAPTPSDENDAQSFDAAYWMLAEDEQYALRCIGAIGTARIAPWALQATLGDSDGDESRAIASRLARTGLIDRTNSDVGGVPAYEVPESVSAYALQLTDDQEKSEALGRLHAQQLMRSSEQPVARIRKQVYPLMREGRLRQSIDRVGDALALTRDKPNPSEEAVCFAALAELYAELGEISAAADAAERALKLGGPDSRARAYRVLGKLHHRAHHFSDAKDNLNLALDLARDADDQGEQIRILAQRAIVLGRQDDFQAALDDTRTAYELCTPWDVRQLPVALHAHAAVYLYMASAEKIDGRSPAECYAQAAEILAEGYAAARDDAPQQGLWMTWIRHAQAQVALGIGELDQGLHFANDALASFKDKRHRYGVAHCRLLLGVTNLRGGLPQAAANELLSALETFRNCGDTRAEADVSLLLAQAFLELGKPTQAWRLQRAAVDRYLALQDRATAREAAAAATSSLLRRFTFPHPKVPGRSAPDRV